MAVRKTPRRAPRSREAAREVVTLADLAPRHDIRGGTSRRVFGAGPPTPPAPRGGKPVKSKSRVG